MKKIKILIFIYLMFMSLFLSANSELNDKNHWMPYTPEINRLEVIKKDGFAIAFADALADWDTHEQYRGAAIGMLWHKGKIPDSKATERLTLVSKTNSEKIYSVSHQHYRSSPKVMYVSYDEGQTWKYLHELNNEVDINSMYVDPKDINTLYAYSYNDKLIKSTNSGENWTEMRGLPNIRR